MLLTPPPERERAPEVRGEFSDRRTDNITMRRASGAAESASTITRSSTVEARDSRSRIRSAGRGGTRSSSSCSASRISRARRRSIESPTEPVPPIPDIYLTLSHSHSSTTSISRAPSALGVTRTRSSAGTSSQGGDSGEQRSGNGKKSEDQPLRRTRSVSRGRGLSRSRSCIGHGVKETGVGERAQAYPPASASPRLPGFKRRQSEPLQFHNANSPTMPRSVAASDIFLDYARENSTMHQDALHNHSHRRSLSRTSYVDKRKSLDAMPRPSTSSGNVNSFARPSPRLTHVSRASTDLQRHMDQYSSPRLQNDDSASISQAGRRRGFTSTVDRSPLTPRSPEISQFGRRRPSFGVMSPSSRERRHIPANQDSQDESRTDNEERKPAESASGDSQSVDTVWDELDDLKSRIKKLELTGKLPPTSSSAAVSGGSSDRPRTATTAPTTIDSSPKQGRKQEAPTPHAMTPPAQPETPNTPAGTTAANIHPLLHDALAKAKPLLNSTLFRSLEATATDALQLAAMTGSAGPQGTTFSAASIINGVTVSDRHVRRKADNMCRNLTDLCLALCEGKHEAPSVFSSPSTMSPALQRSPSLRYTRSGLGSASTVRPASRLEARRSSILGAPPSTASDISPRGSVGDLSGYEGELSPPQQQQQQHYLQAPTRTSRASSTRLRSSRLQNRDDISGNEDEDPTIRPLSRAMTDAGSFRTRPRIVSESRTPGPGQHRFRETLTSSRVNEDAAYENSRVSSYGADPRYSDPTSRRKPHSQLYHSTPSTVAEEDDPTLRGGDFHSALQSRRIMPSLQYSSSQRRAIDGREAQQRNGGGLQQRRHVVCE